MHWAILLCFICCTINLSACVLRIDQPMIKQKTEKTVLDQNRVPQEKSSNVYENMESVLKKILNSNVMKLKTPHMRGWTSISSIYRTEDNKLIFVKENSKTGSDKLFNGEFEGLKSILNTKTVLAPYPIATGCINKNQHYIVMEYLNMTRMFNSKYFSKLGSLLADMHLHNVQQKQSINKFGFHVETCNGFIPQNNTWTDDWLTFFTENRLAYQIQLLQSSSENSLEKKKVIENYWPRLKQIIPKFFEGIEVKPSLVHGDLWTGNVAETNSKPVIYDPATFYGHHEYDIASTTFAGGYSIVFYDAYFKKIPKANGFENRMTLYHLFHYLNHWNHFGEGYANSTIEVFDKLFNAYK